MNTVFVGGSRQISRLPSDVKQRLDNVIRNGYRVLVGDANGADKAIQKHLKAAAYDRVTVFCSGAVSRNNLGAWTLHRVETPRSLEGFQFHAAKDREMAREADFGLMIWDGKSPGTVLNVLRLVRAGKKAVLFFTATNRLINIKTENDWEAFLAQCDDGLRRSFRERATDDEWQPRYDKNTTDSTKQTMANVPVDAHAQPQAGSSSAQLTAGLDAALLAADPAAILAAIRHIAEVRGMKEVARHVGLSSKNLEVALGEGGKPHFSTVVKMIASLGLRLKIGDLSSKDDMLSSLHFQTQPVSGPADKPQKASRSRTGLSGKEKTSREKMKEPLEGLLL